MACKLNTVVVITLCIVITFQFVMVSNELKAMETVDAI
jgi:hypothetical protein